MGDADLVALRALEIGEEHIGLTCSEARLIEVKANIGGGPFANFRPVARNELDGAARLAGATPELCYWPPRKDYDFLPPLRWPK